MPKQRRWDDSPGIGNGMGQVGWEVASEEGERESVHINYAQYQVKVALVKLTLTVLSLSPSLCSAQGLPLPPPPSSPPHQKQRTKPVSGQAEVTLLTFMIACCVALAAVLTGCQLDGAK